MELDTELASKILGSHYANSVFFFSLAWLLMKGKVAQHFTKVETSLDSLGSSIAKINDSLNLHLDRFQALENNFSQLDKRVGELETLKKGEN